MISSREILDIVQLIYYAPVLVISAYIAFKHGFKREDGWIFLVILSLLRLIGGSTGIAAVHDPTNGSLIACSIVCATVGLSPLLLALLGFTRRVHAGMSTGPPVPQRAMRLLAIPILVALILGIIAGTDRFSSNPSTVSTSHTYSKATAILYFVSWLGITAILILTFTRVSAIAPGDSKLLYAGLVALPFLLVRLLYTIISAFDYSNPDWNLFNTSTKSVIIQAIMQFLMEVIVVAIYIVAGLLTPAIPKAHRATQPENIEAQNYPQQQPQHQGQVPKYQNTRY